jgi:hypothetical protein
MSAELGEPPPSMIRPESRSNAGELYTAAAWFSKRFISGILGNSAQLVRPTIFFEAPRTTNQFRDRQMGWAASGRFSW